MATASSRRIEIVVAVLLIASLLSEACGVAPTGEGRTSRQDARMLLLAIHSLALGEEDAESAGLGRRGTGVLLRPVVRPEADPINEVTAAIQELKAECARARVEIENLLPEADKSEEIAQLDQACQVELAALQAKLTELKGRRDKSWWRRTWLGRRLAGAWQRVKRTVRKDAPLIVLVAATGGGALVKKYLIQTGRSALRAEGRSELGRTLARMGVDQQLLQRVNLSPGEWPPRRPGSGSQAQAAEEEGAAAAQAVVEDFSPTAPFELPADGLWDAVCTQRPCAGCSGVWSWTLSINLGIRAFESRAEFRESNPQPNGWTRYTYLTHEGRGDITEDGMLHGPFHEVSEQGERLGDVASSDVRQYDGNMYGAFSADLKSICISRGEDPGNYDIDYIRRIGREAFFGPDRGCEAECTISKSP